MEIYRTLPTDGSVVFESKSDQITTVNLAITYELPKIIARLMGRKYFRQNGH